MASWNGFGLFFAIIAATTKSAGGCVSIFFNNAATAGHVSSSTSLGRHP